MTRTPPNARQAVAAAFRAARLDMTASEADMLAAVACEAQRECDRAHCEALGVTPTELDEFFARKRNSTVNQRI